MTHYADLEHDGYFISGPSFRAIGWLSASHDFPVGETPADVVSRLKLFSSRGGGQREIGWPSEFGKHTCELCYAHEGAGEIAVPAGEILYVAPSMISHYVEAHRYAPPAEFVAACMASAVPGTDEYRSAAAPFRILLEQWVAEQHRKSEERSINLAADWVIRHGGDENAVQTWKRMFWSDPDVAPKMCGSVAATLEYLARLQQQFLQRLRERVKSRARTPRS